MDAIEANERLNAAKQILAETEGQRAPHAQRGEDWISIDPRMIVGIREIAERMVVLGLGGYGWSDEEVNRARSAVTTWIDRREDKTNEKGRVIRRANHFPEPLTQTKATGIYDWAEVELWIRGFLNSAAA